MALDSEQEGEDEEYGEDGDVGEDEDLGADDQGREATGGLSGQSGMTYEQDPGEDSVVPSTPKLPLTRRADGFAEAVSSPQVVINPHYFYDSPLVFLDPLQRQVRVCWNLRQ